MVQEPWCRLLEPAWGKLLAPVSPGVLGAVLANWCAAGAPGLAPQAMAGSPLERRADPLAAWIRESGTSHECRDTGTL